MNEKRKPCGVESATPIEDPAVTCDECGAFGAFTFAEKKLCLACYTARGSCCAESEKDYAEKRER